MPTNLARCNLVVQDEDGTIVDGASIEVRDADSLVLVQVYPDRVGADPALGNPFTAADGAAVGFYVASGSYNIVATKDALTRTWTRVALGTAAEFSPEEIYNSAPLTGTPTAPTAAPGTDTPQISTTAFVKAANDVVLGAVSASFAFFLINGTLAASVNSNALTIAIKGQNGSDPDNASNKVYAVIRDVTAANGGYSLVSITAATSLVISAGSTLGFASATPGRIWIVGFLDSGTFRLGAINCLSGTSIYPLAGWSIASSTAEGGAGAADSAQVFYTGAAVTSKPYGVLGYMTWETGLTTAGTWSITPTRIQLFGLGVRLPGEPVQMRRTATGAVATGTTVVPNDDTIPQITEGDEYMTQAITPASAANLLMIELSAFFSVSAAIVFAVAIFQDAAANALAAGQHDMSGAGVMRQAVLNYSMLAATVSATTFRMRAGGAASTTTFNGVAGARKLGGVLNSFIRVVEVQA